MPAAVRDYLDPEAPDGMLRRSNDELNRSFDLGLDPYTGKPLAGVAAARTNSRMMEGLIPSYGVGARPLYGQDMNRAVALRTGSGSVYDDPIKGGEHYITPGVYSRPIYRGRVSAGDLAKIQAPGKAARKQALEGAAYDSEMETRRQIGRYQDMARQAGPELTSLFNRLPEGEQAFLLEKLPEERLASLRSHPLRSSTPPVSQAPARPGPSMFPQITPKGAGGLRPTASLDSDSGSVAVADDDDYFDMAGSET